MFLQSYRDTKQFNERLVDDIAEKLWKQSECLQIKVKGVFAYRGGINVTATAVRGTPWTK
jgi:NADPH-dependent 7-cyano-7-deazaguanine reductase QueF